MNSSKSTSQDSCLLATTRVRLRDIFSLSFLALGADLKLRSFSFRISGHGASGVFSFMFSFDFFSGFVFLAVCGRRKTGAVFFVVEDAVGRMYDGSALGFVFCIFGVFSGRFVSVF